MHHEHMNDCITTCDACRVECFETLYNHCLEMGGKHAEPRHARLMADCIQICQTTADLMRRQSPLHASQCAACAEVCDACADSCDKLAGKEMEQCAEICRRCAEACRKMSKLRKAA
jgi:hypothetical protein